MQESVKVSPFYFRYGRDARLLTNDIINAKASHKEINLDDYATEISEHIIAAWDCARDQIKKAQQKQKRQHDKHV